MLDQYTGDRARGEASMIGEAASMKNAKTALEHLSQLEQKVGPIELISVACIDLLYQ